MKKCFFFIAVILLLVFKPGVGQNNIWPLTIGDTVPDIQLGLKYNVLTKKYERVKLSDYKNKLLVLDFLSTGCSACMQALPGFQQLQLNNSNFAILPVTTEPAASFDTWFSWTKKDRSLYPEFIIQDSILKRYFPHVVISHLVWIDNHRVVRAITDKFYLTQSNIAKIIGRKKVDWPLKKEIADFDFSKPLLAFNKQVPDEYNSLLTYSVIRPYLNGVWGRLENHIDSLRKLRRITLYNKSIIDLYLFANDTGRQFPNSQIELRTPELSRFFYDDSVDFYRSWTVKNQYCYEVVLPLHLSAAEVKRRMREDLDNKFGLCVRMETKLIDCYALTDFGNVQKGHAPIADTDVPPEKRSVWTAISSLLYLLNNSCLRPPLLNESRLDERWYLPADIYTDHLPSLNISLASAGLRIVPVKRMMPVLVIEENH